MSRRNTDHTFTLIIVVIITVLTLILGSVVYMSATIEKRCSEAGGTPLYKLGKYHSCSAPLTDRDGREIQP